MDYAMHHARRFGTGRTACGLAWGRSAMLLVAAGVLCASCALFGDEEGVVSVDSDGLRVTIGNNTDDRIYYNVFGRELSTLIDWIPHLDNERSVPARDSRTIDHADIMMQDGETEAVFYWWIAEERDGERVPGAVNMEIFDL